MYQITDKTKRGVLLAQLTVKSGTTFTGHVNVQGKTQKTQVHKSGQLDGGSWQEHGVCFSIGKGCQKHPRPRHDEV